MEAIIPRCAGLDVHNKEIQTNIRCLELLTGQFTYNEVRSFSTMTESLEALAAWLEEHGVTHVAMESTGVLWKPVFNVLEGRFKVLLCNAQQIKIFTGRKTDVKDCQWICQLLQQGQLRGSFVPHAPLRELRDLTRHRAELQEDRTRVINRLHKVLQDANIKLNTVATDILGASGRAMVQALIAGQTDPQMLAGLAQRRLKRKRPQLVQAFHGHVTEHHRHMLRMHWEHLQTLERMIAAEDRRIEEQLASARLNAACATPCGGVPEAQLPEKSAVQTLAQVAARCDADSAPPTAAPPAQALPAQLPQPNAPPTADPGAVPQRRPVPPPYTFPEAVQALQWIYGIARVGAESILAEIGTNMSQFPSDSHICSWTGICPGNRQSGGKRHSGKTNKGNRWLRRVLTQCAWAATHKKDSYFRALYHRLLGRRGKKRALIAVAHSMLVTIYHMLKYHTNFVDLGVDYFEHLHAERRVRRHIKLLEALGYTITPPGARAAA